MSDHPRAIPKPHKVLGALEHLKSRIERQVAEYDALPDDHPNRDRLASSNAYNRENLPALGYAVQVLQWYSREVSGEAQATTLLDQLVEAIRATRAAKTAEARAQAASLLDEAFDHARCFCDDWVEP